MVFRLQQRALSVLFVNHRDVVSALSALRGAPGNSALALKTPSEASPGPGIC